MFQAIVIFCVVVAFAADTIARPKTTSSSSSATTTSAEPVSDNLILKKTWTALTTVLNKDISVTTTQHGEFEEGRTPVLNKGTLATTSRHQEFEEGRTTVLDKDTLVTTSQHEEFEEGRTTVLDKDTSATTSQNEEFEEGRTTVLDKDTLATTSQHEEFEEGRTTVLDKDTLATTSQNEEFEEGRTTVLDNVILATTSQHQEFEEGRTTVLSEDFSVTTSQREDLEVSPLPKEDSSSQTPPLPARNGSSQGSSLSCQEHSVNSDQIQPVIPDLIQLNACQLQLKASTSLNSITSLNVTSSIDVSDEHDVTEPLGLVQLTNTTFELTSPDYDASPGEEQVCPQQSVNLTHVIVVPSGHVVAVTPAHLNLGVEPCKSRQLTIRPLVNGSGDEEEDVVTFCRTPRQVVVFNVSIVVKFIDDSVDRNPDTGFRLLYSILPESHEPQRLSSGLYDCSVPHFHQFRPLFGCNLVQECQLGEDEEGCEYDSDGCGLGALHADDKCYRVVWPPVNVSWYEAFFLCMREEQNLVTMATPDEWRRFRDVMALGDKFSHLPIFVGLRLTDFIQASVKTLYGDVWEWVDLRAAFYKNLTRPLGPSKPQCAHYKQSQPGGLTANRCDESMEAVYVCEFQKQDPQPAVQQELVFPSLEPPDNNLSAGAAASLSLSTSNVTLFACARGGEELTHEFLLCDTDGPCRTEDMASCQAESLEVPMFWCDRGLKSVPYTFVCDHRAHCLDSSDEDFCEFPDLCPSGQYRCRNKQCIQTALRCDGMFHCADESDENCGTSMVQAFPPLTAPPFIVDISGKGSHSLRSLAGGEACPETHFTCPGGFCLPVYVRCNGFADCPGREDEEKCGKYTCPGFYRCRGSATCLHPSQVCDGAFHCPQHDDEMLCDADCPDACRCLGFSFVCRKSFPVSSFTHVRYLDGSYSGLSPYALAENAYLVRVKLSHCGLTAVSGLTLSNLQHLDVSHNVITRVSMADFRGLLNLRVLVLSHNPVNTLTAGDDSEQLSFILQSLDLSYTDVQTYNASALECCAELTTLNISSGELGSVTLEGFESTPELKKLDISNAPLDNFPLGMLQTMEHLDFVKVDNYKLCCQVALPDDFDQSRCFSHRDEMSSCNDLVQSDTYRTFLWLFAALSICGNTGSFVSRIYLHKEGSASAGSFGILVTNLSVADLLMGVYLAVIGTADQVYRGRYMWEEERWKASVVCNAAGFLSFLSSEVSAFIICLITLDRFLVLRFPLSRLRLSKRAAWLASAVAWGLGLMLAAVPLLPWTWHWKFYGQSGVCVPLPFSMRARFLGYRYSFGVLIVLNFVLFMLIAVGQVVVYYSVRANRFRHRSSLTPRAVNKDKTVARRLTAIVVSDFLCWFPIGLLGLMASSGVLIPAAVNVGVVIFVLPFNSAVNPFLYTINLVLERRQRNSSGVAKEEEGEEEKRRRRKRSFDDDDDEEEGGSRSSSGVRGKARESSGGEREKECKSSDDEKEQGCRNAGYEEEKQINSSNDEKEKKKRKGCSEKLEKKRKSSDDDDEKKHKSSDAEKKRKSYGEKQEKKSKSYAGSDAEKKRSSVWTKKAWLQRGMSTAETSLELSERRASSLDEEGPEDFPQPYSKMASKGDVDCPQPYSRMAAKEDVDCPQPYSRMASKEDVDLYRLNKDVYGPDKGQSSAKQNLAFTQQAQLPGPNCRTLSADTDLDFTKVKFPRPNSRMSSEDDPNFLEPNSRHSPKGSPDFYGPNSGMSSAEYLEFSQAQFPGPINRMTSTSDPNFLEPNSGMSSNEEDLAVTRAPFPGPESRGAAMVQLQRWLHDRVLSAEDVAACLAPQWPSQY